MRKFDELTREQIQRSRQRYDKICNYVFKPFGYTRADIRYEKDLIQENINNITNKFSNKYNNYMKRYPKNPYNIRFSQE